jgi:uncharacterized protein
MKPHPGRVFLQAEWRNLVMLNYEVDPQLLISRVPHGTSLDSFQGKAYISLVGFRFLNTRLLGRFRIPFHDNFSEVNLRFYVRRQTADESRRGVVFIAEVVPRRAISATARLLYGENYKCAAMKHFIENLRETTKIGFSWWVDGKSCHLSAETRGMPTTPMPESLEQFIAEHYWGYSSHHKRCIEYYVSHIPWQVWAATAAGFQGDASNLYGSELAAVIQRPPVSAFVADGSPVTVFRGVEVR